ncbi:hypothetical protein Ga0074812_14742 [Parafrankia irregularis]|uniref:Uncharacterized protein n=1 Tax=Parafrankia irregularis TaxID=795642 RepID=A0A0S4R0S4_9ACTN|nr:hypothetical protein Ga0074812_14742 [Parafrankia irregularis]
MSYLWVDLHDIKVSEGAATTTAFANSDFGWSGPPPTVGTDLTVGDDEGHRCPGAVVAVDGDLVTVRLALNDLCRQQGRRR